MPRIYVDNTAPRFVFNDGNVLSDGLADFGTALVQAPIAAANIRRQREQDAVAQAFRQRAYDDQRSQQQVAQAFRQREFDAGRADATADAVRRNAMLMESKRHNQATEETARAESARRMAESVGAGLKNLSEEGRGWWKALAGGAAGRGGQRRVIDPGLWATASRSATDPYTGEVDMDRAMAAYDKLAQRYGAPGAGGAAAGPAAAAAPEPTQPLPGVTGDPQQDAAVIGAKLGRVLPVPQEPPGTGWWSRLFNGTVSENPPLDEAPAAPPAMPAAPAEQPAAWSPVVEQEALRALPPADRAGFVRAVQAGRGAEARARLAQWWQEHLRASPPVDPAAGELDQIRQLQAVLGEGR